MSTRCGFVALVGAPNAGKSTLMNQLLGQKVAIVSPKAQTTRTRILGILTEGQTQIIFVDTPGMFEASEKFDRAMVQAATSGLSDADQVLFVVDATHPRGKAFEHAFKRVLQSKRPVSLVLNKIDAMHKNELLKVVHDLHARFPFEQIFMVSALKGDGVTDIRNFLEGVMPESVWFYPEDQLSDMTERLLAAEITRESLLHQLHEEVPHALWVDTEQFVEAEDGVLEIHQAIIVERETHKKIVLGKQGARIKEVGTYARRQMRDVLGRPVRLNLFVKVDEKWRDRPEVYRTMGLEY
jgi:GTP-binding protein Era